VERVVTESGEVSARYEYGPFGEEITRRGVGAQPFRFSTKYHDEETGLLYYGYRYYNPRWGRWLSRDPLEEEGFRMMQGMLTGEPLPEKDPRDCNPYAFVLNDPTNAYDYLGLQPALPPGWHGPRTDYDPAANPFDNSDGSWDCTMKCLAKNVLGITVESTVIVAGQPLLKKRFIMPGSSQGTSIIGKMSDVILGDLKLPRRMPTITGGCCPRIAYTKSASRFATRWIPIVGWAMLTYDAAKVTQCVCEECGSK
jgi:RHS repeat-associated protein